VQRSVNETRKIIYSGAKETHQQLRVQRIVDFLRRSIEQLLLQRIVGRSQRVLLVLNGA
jgi:hypothetical protein